MSITETIDKAIRDYAVSGDAMRWAPDDVPEQRAPIVVPQVGPVVLRVSTGAIIEALTACGAQIRALGVAVSEALGHIEPRDELVLPPNLRWRLARSRRKAERRRTGAVIRSGDAGLTARTVQIPSRSDTPENE